MVSSGGELSSTASTKRVVRYGNCDVERVVAIVPRGHRHLRLVLEFPDQVVVLSEATVAAIVRAYVSVVAHPARSSAELVLKRFERGEVKPGYAECQLVETTTPEEELQRLWRDAVLKRETCGES